MLDLDAVDALIQETNLFIFWTDVELNLMSTILN